MLRLSATSTLACILSAGALGAAPIFSEDFSSGAASAAFGGAGVVNGMQGYAAADGPGGFEDFFLHNTATGNPAASTTLTLSGLAPHTTLAMTFDFAAIDSWDGASGSAGPDFFNITLDGSPIYQASVEHQNDADEILPAGTVRTAGSAALGFNASYPDEGYAVTISNIAHTGSTAVFAFFASGAGWQGGSDESWAIDNMTVTSDASAVVPAPAALPLLLLGLGGLFAVGRRR